MGGRLGGSGGQEPALVLLAPTPPPRLPRPGQQPCCSQQALAMRCSMAGSRGGRRLQLRPLLCAHLERPQHYIHLHALPLFPRLAAAQRRLPWPCCAAWGLKRTCAAGARAARVGRRQRRSPAGCRAAPRAAGRAGPRKRRRRSLGWPAVFRLGAAGAWGCRGRHAACCCDAAGATGLLPPPSAASPPFTDRPPACQNVPVPLEAAWSGAFPHHRLAMRPPTSPSPCPSAAS